LVEREGGGRLFSFQHQQFQEWYASFWVEDIFLAAARGEPPAQQQRDTILNRRPWEEALLFAIERLSRADDRSADACASAILRALGIDPMLAAEMMQRAGGGIWPRVADSVLQFATTWFATAEADRAVLFMITTGRLEFADSVWGVLQNPRSSGRLSLRRVRSLHLFSATIGEPVSRAYRQSRAACCFGTSSIWAARTASISLSRL
jgi:hypothetical protein